MSTSLQSFAHRMILSMHLVPQILQVLDLGFTVAGILVEIYHADLRGGFGIDRDIQMNPDLVRRIGPQHKIRKQGQVSRRHTQAAILCIRNLLVAQFDPTTQALAFD